MPVTRRKGKWAGGHPILGYDVDPQEFRLIVNEDEAERVRSIFALYLESDGLLQVVVELDVAAGETSAGRRARARTVAASGSPAPACTSC